MSSSLVLKIGAVIVRPRDKAVLIVQPVPKTAQDVPAYVLPRGSRQYAVVVDGQTQWHDARDAGTGARHADTLEPYRRGLTREIEEEAGITPQQLAKAKVVDMGVMDFTSRSKGVYPIYWFLVVPDEDTAARLTHTTPVDALSSRWASLEGIRKLAAAGKFSAGYLPVVEKALNDFR